MHHRVGLLVCAVTLTLLGLGSRAAADDLRDDDYDNNVRIYGGLGLGFGGTINVDATGPFGVFNADRSDDLATTIGGQVGFDIPVMRYLSLGGEARLLSFNSETLDNNNVDRSKLLDIDFKPRLRIPLRRSPVELYVTLPVGLTVPFLQSDFGDANVGWNLGVGAGVNWWLTRAFALNVEPMFLMHWFDVDGDGRSNADVKMRQFTLFINGVVAL